MESAMEEIAVAVGESLFGSPAKRLGNDMLQPTVHERCSRSATGFYRNLSGLDDSVRSSERLDLL